MLRPDALVDILQDVAALHAQDLGLGMATLAERGMAWALARQRLLVERLPAAGERITVETWPRGFERTLLLREFRVTDDHDAVIARATTAWVALSLATRSVVADPRALIAAVPTDPEIAAGFTTRTIPSLRQPERERTVAPRFADLDGNGHVNHARLMALLLEGMPREVLANDTPRELDLLFRAECRLDDTLTVAGTALGSHRYRLSLRRTADAQELVRGAVVWDDALAPRSGHGSESGR